MNIATRQFYETCPECLKTIETLNNRKHIFNLKHIEVYCTIWLRVHNIKDYGSYKDNLKMYSKSNFDMYRRGKSVVYNGMETTVGQLNFFRWFFMNEHHIKIIEQIELLKFIALDENGYLEFYGK